WSRFNAFAVEISVGIAAQDDALLYFDAGERAGKLRVDQQKRRAGVLSDIADLVVVQTKVDRHKDAAEAADAKERGKESGAVLADNSDALALGNADLVEGRCLRPRQLTDPSVGKFPEASSGR